MYLQTIGLYHCNYHFTLFWILLEFHFIHLIYLAFVFYIIEGGRSEHVAMHCVCKTKPRIVF
jgi:hypothetical protein